MNSALARIRASFRKMPTSFDWRCTAIEAAWLAPVLALCALFGGLVDLTASPDPLSLLRLAAIALIVPVLCEEIVFRAALLPPAAPVWRIALAVALFVAWHPLQAIICGPSWAEVVLNPWFLAAVAALGTALSRLYLATGSLWPPVALHWIVVVLWKALGGPSPWG